MSDADFFWNVCEKLGEHQRAGDASPELAKLIDEAFRRARAAVREAERTATRAEIVLHELEPGLWRVGEKGRERELPYRGVGLRAAHAALLGLSPACSEYAGPQCKNPGMVIREAVRKTAANWAESIANCPELASALKAMSVVGDPARLHYRARPHSPIFVLSLPLVTGRPQASTITATNPGA